MSTWSTVSDEELIIRIREGERPAFAEAYHRYVSSLLRYVTGRIGSREEAEEMVQDVFVSLWARHDSLTISSLRHYLFSSVKYKIIRHISHSRVRKKYEEHYRLFETVYENVEEHERDPERIRLLLEKGLAQLPERCRAALKLRLGENLSNSDIAMRMNISKGTVENYMVTALQHLRSLYQAQA